MCLLISESVATMKFSFIALLTGSVSAQTTYVNGNKEKPNLIWIVTDDQDQVLYKNRPVSRNVYIFLRT